MPNQVEQTVELLCFNCFFLKLEVVNIKRLAMKS